MYLCMYSMYVLYICIYLFVVDDGQVLYFASDFVCMMLAFKEVVFTLHVYVSTIFLRVSCCACVYTCLYVYF